MVIRGLGPAVLAPQPAVLLPGVLATTIVMTTMVAVVVMVVLPAVLQVALHRGPVIVVTVIAETVVGTIVMTVATVEIVMNGGIVVDVMVAMAVTAIMAMVVVVTTHTVLPLRHLRLLGWPHGNSLLVDMRPTVDILATAAMVLLPECPVRLPACLPLLRAVLLPASLAA